MMTLIAAVALAIGFGLYYMMHHAAATGAATGSAGGTYTCYLKKDNSNKGTVKTWWGGVADASWACDNWVPDCGQGGGCTARA
jgi:hypothetical protein